MMKFLALTLLVATASAFTTGRSIVQSTRLFAKIDEAKIKDAAEHFGKYSVKEIQEMRNGEWNE